MIRVLIAEDSQVVVEYIKHILVTAGNFDIVGVAKNGEEALALAQITRPDVVIMDIQMPRMDGYEATRKIMETKPVPIVICTSSWKPEDAEKTFKAMEAGALAIVAKPGGPGSADMERSVRELLDTVTLMSDVPVVRRWPRKDGMKVSPAPGGMAESVDVSPAQVELVAVGASTGGPPALQTILGALLADFPAPVLIVQHIAEGFLASLVSWLNQASPLSVSVAKHGESFEPAHVYLAPEGLHMGVSKSGRIVLERGPAENHVCPSVSYLFRSVAREYGRRAAGVLLTGMGRDGADGLKLMKEEGGITIAQDKDSCVVHGMAGEAIKLDAAAHVLPPEGIAAALRSMVCKGKGIAL